MSILASRFMFIFSTLSIQTAVKFGFRERFLKVDEVPRLPFDRRFRVERLRCLEFGHLNGSRVRIDHRCRSNMSGDWDRCVQYVLLHSLFGCLGNIRVVDAAWSLWMYGTAQVRTLFTPYDNEYVKTRRLTPLPIAAAIHHRSGPA